MWERESDMGVRERCGFSQVFSGFPVFFVDFFVFGWVFLVRLRIGEAESLWSSSSKDHPRVSERQRILVSLRRNL